METIISEDVRPFTPAKIEELISIGAEWCPPLLRILGARRIWAERARDTRSKPRLANSGMSLCILIES